MENSIKKVAPTLVKSFANWFELDICIKLFGVVVFKYHYPPSKEAPQEINVNNVFDK